MLEVVQPFAPIWGQWNLFNVAPGLMAGRTLDIERIIQ
jgi:hypothetical protein